MGRPMQDRSECFLQLVVHGLGYRYIDALSLENVLRDPTPTKVRFTTAKPQVSVLEIRVLSQQLGPSGGLSIPWFPAVVVPNVDNARRSDIPVYVSGPAIHRWTPSSSIFAVIEATGDILAWQGLSRQEFGRTLDYPWDYDQMQIAVGWHGGGDHQWQDVGTR